MKLNEKNIFLLDGIGAAVSAATTGIILPPFSEWIGLSPANLRLLGLVGLVLAAYSLTCFFVVSRPKQPMLLAIICANLLYCLLALLIATLSPDLAMLGRAYFIGEVAIITGVVLLEASVYRNAFSKRTI